jgi:hypothetical protein
MTPPFVKPFRMDWQSIVQATQHATFALDQARRRLPSLVAQRLSGHESQGLLWSGLPVPRPAMN